MARVLLNELSFHGQCADIAAAEAALATMLAMRSTARAAGFDIECTHSTSARPIAHNMIVAQAIPRIRVDLRRAFMQWVTMQGPFWTVKVVHAEEDVFEVSGVSVTGSAIAEVATLEYLGEAGALVSVAPSDWTRTPVVVRHTPPGDPPFEVAVRNFWEPQVFATYVASLERVPHTWAEVEERARRSYPNLTISPGAFEPLHAHPFSRPAADRIIELLGVLSVVVAETDDAGKRSQRGNEVYQEHFVGGRAWFSDSSTTEVARFRRELTFPDPDAPSAWLFCPMHGKVSTGTLRMHFSWPMDAGRRLVVAYVGPKLTKR